MRVGLTLGELVDGKELQISYIFLHHHDPGFGDYLHYPDPFFSKIQLGVLIIELG